MTQEDLTREVAKHRMILEMVRQGQVGYLTKDEAIKNLEKAVDKLMASLDGRTKDDA